MNKFCLTLIILSFSMQSIAQECHIKGYGSGQVRYGNINGSGHVLVGGYGGWLLGNRLMLGGGGFGTFQAIHVNTEKETYKYELGYQGMMVEYTLPVSSHWRLIMGTLVGGGSLEREVEKNSSIKSDLFVAEPHLQISFSVSSWLQACTGLQYRFVSSNELPSGIKSNDLSSISTSIGLKIGYFPKEK